MNRGIENEKLSVGHRRGPTEEVENCDKGKTHNECERTNGKDKQLAITRSQARWLQIGERLGKWLQSLMERKK